MVFILKQLFFDQSIIFIFIISIASVIIQHILLLISLFINHGSVDLLTFKFEFFIKQMFWGVLFIPQGIGLMHIFWKRWNYMIKLMHKKFVQDSRG